MIMKDYLVSNVSSVIRLLFLFSQISEESYSNCDIFLFSVYLGCFLNEAPAEGNNVTIDPPTFPRPTASGNYVVSTDTWWIADRAGGPGVCGGGDSVP